MKILLNKVLIKKLKNIFLDLYFHKLSIDTPHHTVENQKILICILPPNIKIKLFYFIYDIGPVIYIFVPNFSFLCFTVSEKNACDRRTDGRTDERTDTELIP